MLRLSRVCPLFSWKMRETTRHNITGKRNRAMGRGTTGSLYTRGKQKNYYLRWQHDGKVRAMRLTGDDGKPITRIKEAQKAAERLLALYRDSDAAVRLGRVKADLETADQRAQQARRTVANQKCTVDKALDVYLQADPGRDGNRKDRVG